MANQIPLAYADLELQLSTAISATDTTFSLSSATDDDGNSLPAGKYCFTVDNGLSTKEYLLGQLNGTDVTSVVSVSRQGVESSGAVRAHRVGATVLVTDFATIQRVADILRGQVALDGDNPVGYDAEPSLSDRKDLATVGYVIDTAAGGTVAFDNLVTAGPAGETVAAGELVYFKTSDQEWYLVDATLTAEVNDVQLGFALGAGSDGVTISGGIQIAGTYTTTSLTAGSTYYASDTPGAIGTSAGTVTRVVGVALSTTKLLLIPVNPESLTSGEKAAMTGVNNLPTATNQFVTTDDLSDDSVKPPQVVVFTGDGTWTKDAGLKYVVVEVQAGGGGSGGVSDNDDGSGGGGGGYSKKLILASALGATEAVTVGAAGTAGASTPTAGGDGGASSFGAHATTTGGGGSDVSGGTAGAGGTGASGDINITGQSGGPGGGNDGTAGGVRNGHGGNSILGFGAICAGGGAGVSGTGYGAGASGAVTGTSTNVGGAAGTAGIIIVTEYYS
jgi:hypothetical protein